MILPGVEQIARAAAEVVVDAARGALSTRGRFTFVLSGGSTPRRLYELLAEPPWRERVDWPRVDFFWGDERAVSPDHAESNFRMANEAFLGQLEIDERRVHRMPAERRDLDEAARDYQEAIARVFDASPGGVPPAFDLVLLGMGADGHTASLFPHTPALDETARWVVPNHVPRLKSDRLTLTVPVLNRAAAVLFLVAGKDKAEPLAEVLDGPSDLSRLPAQRIDPGDGELIWLLDGAAAARLSRPSAKP